jgi:4-amino-4-deoxy-L-arabinose transferase-like glycosyltransferase
LDVQKRALIWRIGLGAILLLALALRLKGIHNPILDHPGWRQGDTASIARNFATLQYNIFYPQTNYNGPPPNYVELELQIVPFIAATLYKIVGVHEVIGRLTSIAFSLGTVAVLAYFGRWLFAGEVGGLLAALLFAIMPGSFYYGRTFTPDTTMVFFMTAALYVYARMLISEETWTARRIAGATALLTLAFLAKPVSLTALIPIGALSVYRARSGRTFNWAAVLAMLAIPLALLYGYDRYVASHAEWHWASGITTLHVIPSLTASLQSVHAFQLKFNRFQDVLDMLSHSMIGPALSAFAILGFFFLPATTRTRTLLWGWLIGGLAYTYVVVTVERVDYYMYLLLPLAALTGSGFLLRLAAALQNRWSAKLPVKSLAVFGLLALAGIVYQNRRIVAPYYYYNKQVYRNAVALNALLAPNAIIVMGHYDPSVLYYIGRYGWEEDPYLWTPIDERSAIGKGARYFIAIEKRRFRRNVELCAFMQRFPVLNPNGEWPVYVTDPARMKPGYLSEWHAFRKAERAGHAREWLDAQGYCRLSQP